jgi:hypothetical protein
MDHHKLSSVLNTGRPRRFHVGTAAILLFWVLFSAQAQGPTFVSRGTKIAGVQNGTRSGNTTVFGTTNGVLTNGDCVKIDVNGNLVDNGTSCAGAAASQLHSISFVIDGGGSVIALGDAKVYPTADFTCTINRWDISADQSGSITVDVWKAAGAIPVAGNKISASAPLTLSTAQLAQNGSLSGWTLGVSSGDVFGFSVATATTVTRVTGQLWCQ